MNKEDLFAKMKYRLGAAYPQYEFIIKENALQTIAKHFNKKKKRTKKTSGK